MGAHRWQFMPFRQPFSMADKWFVKNMSSPRIKLITQLFYRIRPNPAKAPSANPFGRSYLHRIGRIHLSHAVARANNSPWWWCLWVVLCWNTTPIFYYSYHTKPTEREFFVSDQTKLVVKLLTKYVLEQNGRDHDFYWVIMWFENSAPFFK